MVDVIPFYKKSNRSFSSVQFIDHDQPAAQPIRGILQCHGRVNPNSLFQVTIETQASVARGSGVFTFCRER
jgi:hypothetical protein